MADIKYLDLDLQIEHSPTGYRAKILNSPAGQAASDFSLPFSDLELENFMLRLGGARRGVRRLESPEMEAAKAFGSRLFSAVFAGDLRSCLLSSQYEAEQQGAGLRVRLRLSEAPELGGLPWEYLYNSGLNRFLALSVKTPLVRYLDLPERIRPLTVKPPLRVLAMISNPSDYEPLDVEGEFGKLQQSLADAQQRGMVEVEKLPEASLVALQRRLQQGAYHIFHFVGHGGFDERQQDGVLILQDQDKRGRRVSAQYLGTVLHDHGWLRLAVLNACEGARTSRTDPFAGVAQSLVQQGIPAVIAMQFEITDEAAITFAQEFYGALSLGYPVDGALAEARKTIFAQGNELEWGTPVLYLRAPEGRIFDLQEVSEEDKRRVQVAGLVRDAQLAAAGSDWGGARAKAEAVLALDAANADATKILDWAKQQQARTDAYGKARAEYDARHWREALSLLNALRGYRDANALIANAERELAKVQEVHAPVQAPAGAAMRAAPPTTTLPEAAPRVRPRGKSNRVLIGAGVLVVLLFGLVSGGWFVWNNIINPPMPSPPVVAIAPTAASTAAPAATPPSATITPTAIGTFTPSSTPDAAATQTAKKAKTEQSVIEQENAKTGTAIAFSSTQEAIISDYNANQTATAIAATALAPAPTSTPLPPEVPTLPRPPTSLGRLFDFESFGYWAIGDQKYGTLTQTSEQTHSGSYSGKLAYAFPAANDEYVIFRQRQAMAGNANALSAWVYGDGSGHFLSVWVIDNAGTKWAFTFGQIMHTGWKQLTASFDAHRGWPNVAIDPAGQTTVAFPIVAFDSLVLDAVPHNKASQGTIYVDDLYTLVKPQVAGSCVIGSPADGSTVSSWISVTGTAASNDLEHWEIDWRPDWVAAWQGKLYSSRSPVNNAKLMDWQTGTVGNGDYHLRLVVFASDGSTLCERTILLRVRN